MDYRYLGNEMLLPLAVAGDELAVSQLNDRGNIIVDLGPEADPRWVLEKTRQFLERQTDGTYVRRTVKVRDGKVVERA